MRRYIRHPSNVPIDFQLESLTSDQGYPVNGCGLLFLSHKSVERGSKILVQISIKDLPNCAKNELADDQGGYEAKGTVVWCKKSAQGYDIAVMFTDPSVLFSLRMVEQACYIEDYRRESLTGEGRVLSSDEAAEEWVQRYAADFP